MAQYEIIWAERGERAGEDSITVEAQEFCDREGFIDFETWDSSRQVMKRVLRVRGTDVRQVREVPSGG